MPKNLIKRGNTWHVKVAIPADVQPVFGKQVFQQSLKTGDLLTAETLRGPLVIKFKKMIAEARGNPTVALEDQLNEISSVLQKARAEPHVDEDAVFAIQQEAEDLLLRARGAWQVEELKPEQEAQVVRDFKVVDGQLTRFEEHLEDYVASRKVEATTIKKDRHTIPKFAEKCPMLEEVDKRAVRAFVKRLSDEEGLSNTTIKDNLSTLRTYWKWLANEELVSEDMANPFENVKLPAVNRKEAAKDVRLAFSKEDIGKLHAAIEGGRSEMMKATFMLAIYTGCRLEELTSLEAANVTEDVIEIVGAKTAAGNRTIPVHDAIKPLVAELKGRGHKYLLPDLVTNSTGKRSPAMSKQFGKVKSKLGFDGRYVFHCIRKTVSTQFEQAGVPEGVAADILGHEKKTMSYGLYAEGSSLEQMREAIKILSYGL